jgi:uncharacterized protein YrrD
MISGKQLHGLKVKDKNHHELGIVVDLLVEKTSGTIEGFIVDLPGIIAKRAFVAKENVERLDLTGLYVSSKVSFSSIKKTKHNRDAFLRMNEVQSGKGIVKDLFLEKEQIVAAEVSMGILSDMREGRNTIPWEQL